MASLLSDLDELVLKCRDQKTKEYIKEAISCYQAGAFRSAIISTWIAVFFDILEKLKELSLAGDKEAEKKIKCFENARSLDDFTELLKFERSLLDECKNKFELISSVELLDLERLREDRNRCAHPSIKSDDEAFSPPAELARMHIRSAIEHLLQHPPAQGKYALGILISLVDSEYFPSNIKQAIIAFENSPLKKARNSLTRNFIIILLKKFINNTKGYIEASKISTALNAIEAIHLEQFNNTLKDKLSSIVRATEDKYLDNLTILIRKNKSFWSHLEADLQQKLKSYVEKLPKESLDTIDMLLLMEEFQDVAQIRLQNTTMKEISDHLIFASSPKINDRIIDLYLNSETFEIANSCAPTVMIHARKYTKEQIQKIIESCAKNNQITGSYTLANVIEELRKNKSLTYLEFNDLLLKAGFSKFIKI